MTKNSLKLFAACLMAAILHLNLLAQKVQPISVKMPKAPAGVAIDGQISDWSDTSFTLNKESGLNYLVAVDDANLYFVANIKNPLLIKKVMGAGITISINTEGKTKKTYNFTYPTAPNPDWDFVTKIQKQLITAQTSGFKGVDNTITVPEEHGLKSAYLLNQETMAYEVSIPLKLLNIKPAVNMINVNICVNALEQSEAGGFTTSGVVGVNAGSPPPTGRKGGKGGHDKSQDATSLTKTDLFTATDFWLSYTL